MKKLAILFAMVFAVSMAMGQDNDAIVEQYGTNIAEIEQIGDLNEGFIYQGASGSAVTNSGSNGASDWKLGAFITQEGTDNTAEIDMNTSDNGAKIDQLGDYNWAKQELNVAHSKTTDWDKMGLDVNQDGNNNWANQKTVLAFGTDAGANMIINQVGDHNVADQLSIGGWGQKMQIEQIGHRNNNPLVSGYSYDVSATGLTDPLALPWAHKPAGVFTQYAYENHGETDMYVEGDDNNTHQYQEYGLFSVSGQNDAWMDVVGSRNNIAQGQLGDLNESDIDVNGDDNVVTTSQHGDDNWAKIELLAGSNDNVAGIEQSGDLNTASILQSGVTNFAKVIQQP